MRPIVAALAGMLVLAAQDEPAWVARSDDYTQIVLELLTKYRPERASSLFVRGLDEEVSAPGTDQPERFRRDAALAREELERCLRMETDPNVHQDLEILIGEVDLEVRESQVNERLLLPYDNAADIVFEGMWPLLQEVASPARQLAAVKRLRRYAGMEPGYVPITVVSEREFTAGLQKNPKRLGPIRQTVVADMDALNGRADEIQELLEKWRLTGWQESLARLRTELAQYRDFLRTTVLPKCRTDAHLPVDLYSLNLARAGITEPIDDLARAAHRQFREIQGQMQPLALTVARERGWKERDYRDVLRRLHQEQLTGETIESVYRQRIAQLDDIIRAQHLLTPPPYAAIVRLATQQETEGLPVPRTLPPPLVNNRRERAQFIVPLEPKGSPPRFDDYNSLPASWTIASHEVRPGRELQYQFILGHGVSLARGLFAVNTVNNEGWAMYAEWMMFPYMPDDGKLISLELRLMRTARAFLDPELEEGRITPAEALRVLRDDVVLSPTFTNDELARYTSAMPGQAVSYFAALRKMLEMRRAAESALGPRFSVQAFNDFVLSEGLLPLDLLQQAVTTQFIPAQQK